MATQAGQDYTNTLTFATINDKELTELLNGSKEFKYQGLDVQELNKLMLARGKKSGRKPADVMADVRTLCMWIIMRGTNIEPKGKAINSTSANGKRTIETLIGIYDITRSGKPKGPEIITMGRLASTYPHIILGIRVSLLASDQSANLVRMIGGGEIPRSARFPTFAALIPLNGDGFDTIYSDWLEWADSFDAVINGDKKNPANVRKYADIMRNNSPLDDKQRENMLLLMKKDPSYAGSSWEKLLK